MVPDRSESVTVIAEVCRARRGLCFRFDFPPSEDAIGVGNRVPLWCKMNPLLEGWDVVISSNGVEGGSSRVRRGDPPWGRQRSIWGSLALYLEFLVSLYGIIPTRQVQILELFAFPESQQQEFSLSDHKSN